MLRGFSLASSVTIGESRRRAPSTLINLGALNEYRAHTRDTVGPLTLCSQYPLCQVPRLTLNGTLNPRWILPGAVIPVGASRLHKVKPKAVGKVTNTTSIPKRLCLDRLSFKFFRYCDFTQWKTYPSRRLPNVSRPVKPHAGTPASGTIAGVRPGRRAVCRPKVLQFKSDTDFNEADC